MCSRQLVELRDEAVVLPEHQLRLVTLFLDSEDDAGDAPGNLGDPRLTVKVGERLSADKCQRLSQRRRPSPRIGHLGRYADPLERLQVEFALRQLNGVARTRP